MKYRLQLAWKLAQEFIERDKQLRVQRQRDINPLTLRIDEKVKLTKENRQKLDAHYTGPYVVTNVDGPNVTITDGVKQQIVHRNRLVLY